jgi:hypothetical protein
MRDKGRRAKKRSSKQARAIVLLQDLAPRKDPTGGSGKVAFGQDVGRPAPDKKTKSKE